MNNALDTPSKKLSKRQLAELASFTDPGHILSILAKEDWSIDTAIKSLVEIAKGDGKESVKLGAIKYLNQMVIDAMSRAGMIVTATKRLTDGSGEEIKFTGSIVSNSLKSQKEGQATDETQPEQIATIVEKNNDIAREIQEEEKKQEEETKEDDKESGGESIDMSLSKFPEAGGTHAGQFGGISTSIAVSGPSGSLNLL